MFTREMKKKIFQKEISEMFDLSKKKKILFVIHKISTITISFFPAGDVNNIETGTKMKGKIYQNY